MPKHCIIGANSTVAKHLIRTYHENNESCHLIARSFDDESFDDDMDDYLSSDHVSSATADVLDFDALKNAIEACEDSFCSLTYCPGSIALKSLQAITEDDVREHLDLNATGALMSAKFCRQKLLDFSNQEHNNTASIVFISSVAARRGFTKHALVSMAKAAVEGLTVALAKECAPSIRVNCVAPSLTKTKLSKNLVANEAVEKALSKTHALNRLGEAADIANAIHFLHSPQAAWISGQILPVDGGKSTIL